MNNPLSILVTGGCGYVGSILVKKLVDEGFNVKVIDSLIFGKDSIEKLIQNKSVHLVDIDLRDTQKIKSELTGNSTAALFRVLKSCNREFSTDSKSISVTNKSSSNLLASLIFDPSKS